MTDSSARPSRTSLLPAIDPKKFEVFEQSFLEARDAVKLARLYLSYAAQESDASISAERLRRGVRALAQLADSQEQVSWLLHELVRLDPQDDGIEMGYWIARPFWGRGFATEAGRALLMLSRMLGHRTIRAGHAVDNPASGKVLRKLGFRPTGEIRSQFSKGRGAETPVARYEKQLETGESSLGPAMVMAA